MISDLNSKEPDRIAFLMVPNFSMIAFTSAIEPLRMANQLSRSALYEWITVSADGEPVSCSNGIPLSPDRSINDRERYDAVFVCGGNSIPASGNLSGAL